jgi:hypothetical protein
MWVPASAEFLSDLIVSGHGRFLTCRFSGFGDAMVGYRAPVHVWRDKGCGKGARNVAKDLSSTTQRKKLSTKSFALPGKRKYPIPDKAHARNALARVAQNGTPAERKTVRAAVKKRFPSIGTKKS